MSDVPADPIASPEDLAAWRSGDAQKALDAATAEVRAACGWHVAPSLTETIQLVGRGDRWPLWLPSLHVTAITAVRYEGDLVDVADYSWSTGGRLSRLAAGWWRAGGLLELDITHGFEEVPEDFRALILARAARIVDDPKGNLAQVARGPFSEQYNTGGVAGFDPANEARVIARYRIPVTR